MNEIKCPECGVTHVNGPNHVCKPEDVEKQKQIPKKMTFP